MSLLLHLVLLQGFILPLMLAQEGPVVSTKYGQVEGVSKETAEGNPYDEFRGIPYGATTAGSSRFKKPQEPAPWDGILPAKEYGRSCAQLGNPLASENCLSVNVCVPDSVEDHLDDPLPVMVWYYGGAYLLGSSRMYNGQLLSTRGRVVVVTVNYRVGVTGFLSTENEASPGNYGLWDQIAALRWVQDNIASFGGDSDRVTIFGQSAGGMSVSHLALSPAAQGLFHRVIAMSGSASSYAASTTRQRMSTTSLAQIYECPVDNDDEMVECLRGVNSLSLNLNGVLMPIENGYLPNFVPVVDNDLVSVRPLDAMEQGLNANYDFMAGRTVDDGSLFSLPFSNSSESFRGLLIFMFNVWENREELADMVFEQYPDLASENDELRDKAGSRALTDLVFGCGVYQEVGYHSQNAASTGKSTYFYEFDYSYFFKDFWISGTHVEDVIYLLGDYSPLFTFDDDDNILSRNLQAYYSNFAYTGNPNEGPHPVPTEWPQYDTVNKIQMRESVEMTAETLSDEIIAKYDWWNEVFYPAAIPAGNTSGSTKKFDINRFQKRVASLMDKLANLDLDNPMAIGSVLRAIMETGH